MFIGNGANGAAPEWMDGPLLPNRAPASTDGAKSMVGHRFSSRSPNFVQSVSELRAGIMMHCT
jgi:hypothetical protein